MPLILRYRDTISYKISRILYKKIEKLNLKVRELIADNNFCSERILKHESTILSMDSELIKLSN